MNLCVPPAHTLGTSSSTEISRVSLDFQSCKQGTRSGLVLVSVISTARDSAKTQDESHETSSNTPFPFNNIPNQPIGRHVPCNAVAGKVMEKDGKL